MQVICRSHPAAKRRQIRSTMSKNEERTTVPIIPRSGKRRFALRRNRRLESCVDSQFASAPSTSVPTTDIRFSRKSWSSVEATFGGRAAPRASDVRSATDAVGGADAPHPDAGETPVEAVTAGRAGTEGMKWTVSMIFNDVCLTCRSRGGLPNHLNFGCSDARVEPPAGKPHGWDLRRRTRVT
jgi:hypothetical protein